MISHDRFGVIAASLALGMTASFASAQPFAKCSFEDAAVAGTMYIDLIDPLIDHPLFDHIGEPVVNFTATPNEIGFQTRYANSRDSVGITDGDFIGVTDFTGTVGAFPDGTQGYELQDPDGTLQLAFDTVFITGVSRPTLRFDLFIKETEWELDDRIRIFVSGDNAVEVDALNTEGSDIDDLGIEGFWNTISLDLTGSTVARLRVEFESDSSAETAYIDNIRFVDGDTLGDLTLTQTVSSCPNTGPATFEVTNGSGDRIVIAYSQTSGQTVIPNGFVCQGTTLDLGAPVVLGNASGDPAVLTIPSVPGAGCGAVFLQALDTVTCDTSNVITFQ